MTDEGKRALEAVVIAVTMGVLTLALATRKEPSWIEAPELLDLLQQDALLLDVRPKGLAATRTLPGAVAIPTRELPSRLDELPHYRPIVVFGAAGGDSLPAYRLLAERGFDVHDLGPMARYPRFLLQGAHRHHHHDE